jgi:catalase
MTATIPALGEEPIPADEEQATLRVVELFRQLRERGYHQRRAADRLDRFPARRDAHAKHHGCLRAELVVENQLPDELRFGTFQEGMHYRAYVRFSNGSEHVQSDKLPDAHAMAVKLLGVHGPRALDLPGGEQHTQDLIMVQHPVFFSRNAREYVSVSEALLAGPDALQAWMTAHP